MPVPLSHSIAVLPILPPCPFSACAHQGFTTNAYFVMAAIQQVVLAMLIMLQTQCVA